MVSNRGNRRLPLSSRTLVCENLQQKSAISAEERTGPLTLNKLFFGVEFFSIRSRVSAEAALSPGRVSESRRKLRCPPNICEWRMGRLARRRCAFVPRSAGRSLFESGKPLRVRLQKTNDTCTTPDFRWRSFARCRLSLGPEQFCLCAWHVVQEPHDI